MNRLRRKIKTIYHSRPGFLLCIVEASMVSWVIQILLWTRRYGILRKWRGVLCREDYIPSNAINHAKTALFVRKVMHVVVRNVPWKPACYNNALTAKILLKRRKISTKLFIGINKPSLEPRILHAWLIAGNQVVTGQKNMHLYPVISVFV